MCNKIILCCCVFLSIMLSISHAEEDILIVTEEWPPYNYVEHEKLTGFSTEIVQQMLETMKKNYEIQLLPSMRSSNTLNTRPHTMMFSMFRTPERESLYKWIGPLGDGTIYFYKRKDNPVQIKRLNDMKNEAITLCSRHAGLIPNLLKEQGFTNVDMGGTKSIQIYQKLLAGRCDLAISDTDLGVRYALKLLNANMDDILEKIPFPIFEAELYIACSKDIPDEEIQQWQAALETLKTNGIYEKIFQKYNQQQSSK